MSPEAKELLEAMGRAAWTEVNGSPVWDKLIETASGSILQTEEYRYLQAALRVLRDLPEFDRSAPDVLDHVAWGMETGKPTGIRPAYIRQLGRIFGLLNELTEPTP